MDPYLEIGPFTTQFGRALSAAESPVATRLLQVVSDWIRGKKPDADELAAAQVVFEVVRDSLNYGGLELLSQFQNTTSLRTEAGTFDPALKAISDYLTDRQKRRLGITAAGPVGSFPKCDY